MSPLGRLFRRRPELFMVCTANVCRSPVAAAALRAELRRSGVSDAYRVYSAGTRVGSPGRLPDPRMKALAAAAGLSLKGERARQLTRSVARRAAVIVVMEQKHREQVMDLLAGAPDGPSVHLLGSWLDVADEAPGEVPEIVDPYYSNAEAMRFAFESICRSCSGLAREIASNKGRLSG